MANLRKIAIVGSARIPFEGARQAGIVQPAQAVGHLAAFDLAPGADRKAAAALLRRWSDAVRAMTRPERPTTPAAIPAPRRRARSSRLPPPPDAITSHSTARASCAVRSRSGPTRPSSPGADTWGCTTSASRSATTTPR